MPKNQLIKWLPIKQSNQNTGRLIFHYSSQSSKLPVRNVQKLWDNKADPNIETGTYGLFSTCMPAIRRRIIDLGDRYIFFFTNWNGRRRVTGYYELEGYVETGLRCRDRRGVLHFPDFALQAKKEHFVAEGIFLTGDSLSRVRPILVNENSLRGYGPRGSQHTDPKLTSLLKEMLDKQHDVTTGYIEEIRRLEEDNLKRTGFKYPSWHRSEGFNLEAMGDFIK